MAEDDTRLRDLLLAARDATQEALAEAESAAGASDSYTLYNLVDDALGDLDEALRAL